MAGELAQERFARAAGQRLPFLICSHRFRRFGRDDRHLRTPGSVFAKTGTIGSGRCGSHTEHKAFGENSSQSTRGREWSMIRMILFWVFKAA